MKLIINKFPPITQRCEIDLSKKVILFVGKNNSGKTYLSQLIWGIYNIDYSYIKSDIEPIDFFDFTEKKEEYSIILDEILFKKVSKNFTTYLKKYKIKEIFKQDMDVDFEVILDLNKFKSRHEHIFSSYDTVIIERHDSKWILSIKNINEENLDVLNKMIEYAIIWKFINITNTYYLPSTRLFLPSFYKYILRLERDIKEDMLLNFDKVTKDNKHFFASSYTQPFDKLIEKLIFSIEQSIPNRYLKDIENIIEGKISVDKAEEISMVDLSYVHESGQKIPMYLSSSMVNQLSIVYLYFKYWYVPNLNDNFLLLDEPEMNLHPSKKIEVMELLLDFASENKLLIATHSSTLAKSLINYLHLFDLKEKKENMQEFIDKNGLDMNLNINLKSNDIGIYAFNGKTIVSYKRDNDSDIHFGTFTEVEDLQKKQFDYIMEELDSYDS